LIQFVMASNRMDQENQHPFLAPRLGLRKENGQQKTALSNVSTSFGNIKNMVQQQQQQTKKVSTFTVFDENASDNTDRMKKTASVWATRVQDVKILRGHLKPVEEVNPNKFSIFQDLENLDKGRQPLAPISQNLEDSTCSFTSVNTSLHQSDFVLLTNEVQSKEYLKIQELSPMVIDEPAHEENKKYTSLAEYNEHFESALPEIYLADIYKYLRDCEARHRPKPHYMRKQADITPGMRSILIDWLVEVAEEYKIHNETLFLAVSFIDRFLSHMSVLRGKLQLVGTAAMFIASKYEEIYPPEVAEFVYITDDTYTKKQVLRMEHLILKVLAFELAVPTSHSFLSRFVQLSKSSESVLHLATYLCELTLLETEPYLYHMPSEVAASCVALARLSFDCDIWPSHLHTSTGYTLDDLLPCVKNLHATWLQAPSNSQQAIRDKYKSEKWHAVSLLTPPPIATLDLVEF